MSLGPGTRLGPYEILAAIGAGGMGEVYRARDTKLGRDVAIKVLPAALTSDSERLARFEREAQVLASLNHPNIAAIHHLETTGDAPAIVMELVEGETLADRIARGPIPIDEALPIARQIAEALEAAHEQGIIHRDLKPANIKVRPDGTVKVLDFGLAKLVESDARPTSLTISPTLSIQATYARVILGTAAYMSPEQARGRQVDRRTDIWAFACVLFEMLTGKPAFDAGESVSDAVAAILTKEPNWGVLPPTTPNYVRTLLRRCFQKDPQKRLPHIGVVRIEINETTDGQERSSTVSVQVARHREWVAWSIAAFTGIAFVAALVPAARYFRQLPAPDPPQIRTQILTAGSSDLLSFAISPDSRYIVYVAGGDGPSRLWLRELASDTARPLSGTEGAAYPFWSPNSHSIAFFSEQKLKRIDVNGVLPQIVVALSSAPRGGTWNANGVILFALSNTGIMRTSTSGDKPVAITKLDHSLSQRFPQFLPDGRHFLFLGIYIGTLDSRQTARLVLAESAGVFMPPNLLAWVKDSTLVAQRFDPDLQRLAGEPIPVWSSVGSDAALNAPAVSVASSGFIAYRSGPASRRQLVWFDRTGKKLDSVGEPDDGSLLAPRLSPDGHRVAAARSVEGNTDIWVLDGTRMTRMTFDAGLDRFPIWSANGDQIAFDSARNGPGVRNLYLKSANGAGDDVLLLKSSFDKTATDWSSDGRFLLYRSLDSQTGRDIWVLPLGDRANPWPFVVAPFEQVGAKFSPDGKWVAYHSNESGTYEVCVRPFLPPQPGQVKSQASQQGQWQVSTSGGIYATWGADGKELSYVAPNGDITAVPVHATGCCAFEAGKPASLFRPRMYGGGTELNQARQYDISRDGRFLVNTVTDDATAPITILQNWKPPTN